MLLNPDLVNYLEKCVRLSETQIALQNQNARMPEGHMQIRPEAMQFLCFLLRLLKPKRILEVGTYTGFSTLSFALHTDDSCFITAVDRNSEWTRTAARYWQMAGVDRRIHLILGDASDVLPTLLSVVPEGFDFIFIDADKRGYADYLTYCLAILAPGGFIAIDNVLWRGDVAEPDTTNVNAQVLRTFNETVLNRNDLMASIVPLGDGLLLVQNRLKQS